MCVVSMVVDHYRTNDPFRQWESPNPLQPIIPNISRDEFDEVKKSVEEIRDALEAAELIDKVTGQPDCEEEKNIKEEFVRKLDAIEDQLQELRDSLA